MNNGKVHLELTPSQQVALADALIEHMGCPNWTQTFVDSRQSPPVSTSLRDLLRLVTGAKDEAATIECNLPVKLSGFPTPSPCQRDKGHEGPCDSWMFTNLGRADDAWGQGYASENSSNPYPIGTLEHDQWNGGRRAAELDAREPL
jgi:hypothetical protein